MSEIIFEEKEKTMTSLELHSIINEARQLAGENKVENSHFLKRVEDELGDELGIRKLFVNPNGGRPANYYDLTLDQCLLVGMRESKSVRRSVRDKLNQLGGSKKPSYPSIPQTYSEALRLAADQAEQLALAAPKVEFVDRYVTADSGSKGFRQVAKLLNANEKEFRVFLKEKRIMYQLGGEWMPYQQHIDAERFVVKTGIAENDHAYNTARFTPKGVSWVAGVWAQYQLAMKLEC